MILPAIDIPELLLSAMPVFKRRFSGVPMPEAELLAAQKFKRGRRFDWLYDQTVTTGSLESLLSRNLDLPDVVWNRLRSETNHELRAALICLLTAALAEKGTAAIIGETEGGWVLATAVVIVGAWAKEGLESAEKRMALKFTSVLDRPFTAGSMKLQQTLL